MNDRLVAILWIVLSSLLGVVGQAVAKLGVAKLGLGSSPRAADLARMITSPLLWGGGALLVAATVLWFYALSKIEFTVAMPISCLLMLVFSVAAGVLCFGETVPPWRGAGLLLALVAVVLISGSEAWRLPR